MTRQSDWILSTKLNPPVIREDILERPDLIKRLECNPQRTLSLFAAPAGYGKSTLAAQWLEKSVLPGVWISLDETDSNSRTFLSYLVAAVRRLHPEFCERIYDVLDAPQLPPQEILATLLANDLAEISDPFLLVLDDYHHITDLEIHDLLALLLQHPPRCLHLVVLTRRDPPFPMVTMRSRGLALEIREPDLQFNAEETGQLLAQVGDIHLNEDDLGRLMQEIEGWITGLRLFCLAIETGEDPGRYLAGLSCGAGHIQDYLVEQVLSRQLPEFLDCLLKSSILDRLCAPLCEAVCKGATPNHGDKTGLQFMETITAAKLFGIQLEPGGKWIRYHHLFQSLLQNYLQRKFDSQEIKTLHKRAAQWFYENGHTEEALKHAFSAADSALAADIIEGARFEAINNDKWARLGKWLDSLPAGVENARPHLLMCRAYLLLHSIRRIAEIPSIMARIVALTGEIPVDPMLAGELNFFNSIPLLYSGKLDEAQHCVKESLRFLPKINEEGRSMSELYMNLLVHLSGDPVLAMQGMQAVVRKQEHQSVHYRGRLEFGLSYLNALSGYWPEAFREAERVVEISRAGDVSFAGAWGVYMQGNAALRMLDLTTAETCFQEAYERRYIKNTQAAIDTFVGLALCFQLQERPADADRCLNDARDFAFWTGDPAKLDAVDSGRARVALLRGDVDSAARWLATYPEKRSVVVKVFFLEYPEITACRVMIARGTAKSLQKVATQLAYLEDDSRRFHQTCQLVPILVLRCLVAFKQDRLQDALHILTEAVGLAWPGRWLLPFIEGGAPVSEMLAQLPDNPDWDGFVSRILDESVPLKVEQETQQIAVGSDQSEIEALTFREMDVLNLLCEHLYDKEIAERLSISPFTVKTHLSHIYGKLGSSGRRAAVKKAKQLGLV